MSHHTHEKVNNLASPSRPYTGTNSPIYDDSAIQHSAPEAIEEEEKRETDPTFSVNLTATFIIHALVLITVVAFVVGRMCRAILLNSVLHPYHRPTNATDQGTSLTNQIQLPSPTVPSGKRVPRTTFTSKLFLQKAISTSSTVHLDRHSSSEGQEIEYDAEEDVIDDNNDELHLPFGQHLLVDIKHVDPIFLNSDVRLAQAMIDLIKESKLTLLSYHCHSRIPLGVSCVGMLLESHVSLHTWPVEGVIVVDLFTCGSASLIPILSIIKKLFAIPNDEVLMTEDTNKIQLEPTMVWSHKLRGFRQGFFLGYKAHENPLEQDLGFFLSEHDFDMKVLLVSEETDFQHVDVLKVIDSRVHSNAAYERSLSNDGSYESLHKNLYRPDRILFLDGIQQSTLRGEAAYHEALVHPSMITHPNPKRVAIIGGGEGATLREVLKHKTVEHVVMVEIDKALVEICKEHLPEWSDCSDIEGIDTDSCFNDSRVSVEFEDATMWFIDRFEDDESTEDKFDVIIMDALDPDKLVEIVESLYKNNAFIGSLSKALAEDGVLVVQVGDSETISDAADEMGPSKDAAYMMDALQKNFESMHEYDEGHSHFFAPWSYIVCFKEYKSRASWYKTAAEIQIELHQRLYGTKSGKPALLFFDAPTMISYQVPSKAKETTHCRKETYPWECDEYIGIDPEIVDIPISHVEARQSTVGKYASRGLFALQDIPFGSIVGVKGSVTAFHVLPSTWTVIEDLDACYSGDGEEGAFVKEKFHCIPTFVEGYGYGATYLGKIHYTIDSGLFKFCNHGCYGTYNYGDDSNNFTEMNIDLDHAPEALLNKALVYSPVIERHLRQIMGGDDYALRDIRQGEEILCNYLSFVSNPDEWKSDVTSLRALCAGDTMGQITMYELKSS